MNKVSKQFTNCKKITSCFESFRFILTIANHSQLSLNHAEQKTEEHNAPHIHLTIHVFDQEIP